MSRFPLVSGAAAPATGPRFVPCPAPPARPTAPRSELMKTPSRRGCPWSRAGLRMGLPLWLGCPRETWLAAGFGLGRSDGMVGTPRRRGDGVEAASDGPGVLPSKPLQTALRALLLGAGSSAQESYTDPTTLFVSSVVDIVRLKSPHKNCSQAVQSFQMKVARNCSSATPSYITRCQQPQRPITALQPTAQPKPAFLRAVPSRAAKTALTQ